MGNIYLSRAVVVTAFACLLTASARTARAQMNTIASGIQASINAGTTTANPIDTAYVVGFGGTGASASYYLADSTGGTYMYKGNVSTQPTTGLTIGTRIDGLSGGSFYYFSGGTEWEYEPSKAGGLFSDTTTTPGDYTNIPSTYYFTTTIAQSTANAPSSSSSQGMRNSLVTIDNVSFPGAGGTFASGSTYPITDGTNTGTVFISANSGLANTTIPSGQVNVSGILEVYNGSVELAPIGVGNVAAAPEPAADAILAVGAMVFGIVGWRGARRKKASGFISRRCSS